MKIAGKKIYIPVLAFLACALILSLILGISIYRNINREKERWEDFMYRQAMALIRSLEVGARTGMMPWWDNAQRQVAIEETTKEAGIKFIEIVNKSGVIVAHSQPDMVGQLSQHGARLYDKIQNHGGPIRQITKGTDGERVFEIIKILMPYHSDRESPGSSSSGRGMMGMMRMHGRGTTPPEPEVIRLGIGMAEFEEIQRKDIHQALIMTGLLLLIGSGSLYLILFAQNYFLINKAFENMKSYTKNVVESVDAGLISISQDGKVVTCNPASERILGRNAKEITGKNLSELLGKQNQEIFYKVTTGERIGERELSLETGSGESIPLSISVSQLQGESGAVVVLRDLREIKELEGKIYRNEKLAAIGRLAAGVAHEIRNPLSSIKGLAQYLEKKMASKREDQLYASVIVKEVDRLNRVVVDLLNYARPRPPELKSCALAELLNHALKLVESDAINKGITVEMEQEEMARLPVLFLDRDQMTQALLNIFINAMDAMESNGKLSIQASSIKEDREVRITISDTGCGIAPEDIAKIFDPFYSKKKTGTGIGLPLAHQIIQAHGGNIEVRSNIGVGTTVIITLPVRS